MYDELISFDETFESGGDVITSLEQRSITSVEEDYEAFVEQYGSICDDVVAILNEDSCDAVTYIDDLENFDPEQATPSDVSGMPERSMEYWEYQGDTGRCALYAQKFIIEELTGYEVDIDQMAEIASENGWFSEEGGTPIDCMDKMLDYCGIENESSYFNSIEDMKECLDNGGKVIVAVDSGEYWFGEEDNMFLPNDGADHAVEVIGIDESDPNHPMVILNDSGQPNGCGEMIPLDVFENAWDDSNNFMITVN